MSLFIILITHLFSKNEEPFCLRSLASRLPYVMHNLCEVA